MYRNKTFNRKKVMIVFVAVFFIMMFLIGRLVYLMIFCSEYYGNKAENLHERERDIKAARGKLLDANGTVLATNKSVCTISVIHNQIEEPEKVIEMLVRELGIPEETARKRVEKVSSIERVKTNVAKETGDAIRAYGLSGVKVDEDNSILRVNMAHIRRKLEQNPAEPQYVFTEIGIGYRMIEDEMQ